MNRAGMGVWVRGLAAVAFLGTLPGCFDWEWRSAGQEVLPVSAEEMATVQRVDVYVDQGVVHVAGEQRGDALVEVEYLGRVESHCKKKGGGYDDDDLAEVLEDASADVYVEQGTLFVVGTGGEDARTDLRLRVPSGLDVVVETGRGEAIVEGVTGEVTLNGVAGYDFERGEARAQ